jgi:hypothetical protein
MPRSCLIWLSRLCLKLRAETIRDDIVHGGKTVDMIFSTEKGFGVDPTRRPFSDFEWALFQYECRVALSVVAHVVMQAFGACTDIMAALASSIQLSPEVAPGYRIFLRDPSNAPLVELGEVANGKRIWRSN